MDKTSQKAFFENSGDERGISLTPGDHNLHHQTQLMWDGGGKPSNSSGLCEKTATSSCRRKSSSPGRSSYPHQKQNNYSRATNKVSSVYDSYEAPVTSTETAKCSFSPSCSENVTHVQKHGKNSLSGKINKAMSSLNQFSEPCSKSPAFVNKSVGECGSENLWKSALNFSSMALGQESQPDSQDDTTIQMSSSISSFNHSCNSPKTVIVQKASQEQKVIPVSSSTTHLFSNNIHHIQSSTEAFLNKFKSGLDVKSNTKEIISSPYSSHCSVGECNPCTPGHLCSSGENIKTTNSGKHKNSVEQHPVPASSLLTSTASKSSATILQVPKFPPPLQHQCPQPAVGNLQNDAVVSGNNSGEIHSQKMLADLLHIHLLNMVAAATNGSSNISPGNVSSGFDLGVAVSILGAASLLSGNFFPCVHHQAQGNQSSLPPAKVVQSQGTSPLRVADEKQTQTTPPVSPVIRMYETHIDCPKTKPKAKSQVSSDMSATYTSPNQHIDSLQKEQRKEFGCFFSSKKAFFKPKRKIEAIVANLKEQKSVASPVSSTSAHPSSSMYLTSSLVQNASVDDLKCDWIPDSSTEASDHKKFSGNCYVKPGTNTAQIEICDSVEGVDNSVTEEALITLCECLPPKIEETHCKKINFEQMCNKIEACNESPNRMKTEDPKVLTSKPKESKNIPGEVEHEHCGDYINGYKSVEKVTRQDSKTSETDALCSSDELCAQLPHQNVFSINVSKSVKSDNCNTTSDYSNNSLHSNLKVNVAQKLCSKEIGVSRKDGDSSEISSLNNTYSVCDKFETSSHSCCNVKSRPIPISHCKLVSVDNEILSNSLPESNIVHSSLVSCGDCFPSNHEKLKLCESSSNHENLILPFQLTSVRETNCVSVTPIGISVDNERTNIVSSNQPPESDTKFSCRLQKSALIKDAQPLTNDCDLTVTSEFDKSKFCAADCSDDALTKSEIKCVGQDDSLPVSTSIKSEVLAYEKNRLNDSRIEDTSHSFRIEHSVDTSSSQGSEPRLIKFSDVQVEERDCGSTVSSSHNAITRRGAKPSSPDCFNLDSDSHLDDTDQVVPCVETEPDDRNPREGKVICSLVLSDLLSEVVEKTVKVLSNTSKDNEANNKKSLQSTSFPEYIGHSTDRFKDLINDTVICTNHGDNDENSTPLNVISVPKHCEASTTESEVYLKTITDEVNHSAAESDPGLCVSLQNLDSICAESKKVNESQGNELKQDFISHNLESNDGSISQVKCQSFKTTLIHTDMPKPFSADTTIGIALSKSNLTDCDISHNTITQMTATTDNIPFVQDSSYLESNLKMISEICSNVEAAISEEKSRDLLNDLNTCTRDSSFNFQSDQKVNKYINDIEKDQIVSGNIIPEGDGCLKYKKINLDSTEHPDSSLPPHHTSSDNADINEISFESEGHILRETSSETESQQIAYSAESNERNVLSNNFKRKYLKEGNSNLNDNLKITTDISKENIIAAQIMIQDASEVLNEDSSSVSIQDTLENVTAEECLTDNRTSSDTLCDTPCKSGIVSLMPENNISSTPVMVDDRDNIDDLNNVGIVEENKLIMKNCNNDELSESCVPIKEDIRKDECTAHDSKQKRQKNSMSLHCKLPLDRLPNCLLEKLSVPEHYQFRLDKGHRTEKGFSCDICASIYKRAFSLKRHYLRSHISYRYLSNRDIANCAIVVGDKMAVKAVPPKKGIGHFPGLYRCHICGECFDDKIDGLRLHLINHPSNITNAEPVPASKLDGGPCHEQSTEIEENMSCTEKKDNASNQSAAGTDLSISKHLCLYCDKKFSSATVKRRHQRRVHQNPQPYKRKQPPVTDFSNLINGSINVRKRRRKCKSRLHKCPYCEHRSATFTELTALVRHLKRNHQNIYHACVPCGERFCKKEELDFHISSGHSKNKFMPQFPHDSIAVSSEVCGKKVNPETNTSTNFCHICPICSKMFTNYRNMCRHKQLAHRNSGTTVSPVTLSPCKSRFINLLLSSESPSTTSFSSETTTTSSSTSSSIGSSRSQSPFVNVPVVLNVDLEEQLPLSEVSTPLSNGRPIKQKIKKFSQSSASQTMTRSMAEISSEHTAEAELTFYNSIASNIRENLLHYLDGKLTKHLVDQADSNSKKEIIKEDFSTTSGIKLQSDVGKDVTQNRSEKNITENPQPNIRLYLSQLDISTQLAMGKNIEKATQVKENQHEDDVPLARVAERVKESDSFHAGLKLVRISSTIIKYLAESTNHQISSQTEKCDSGNLQQQTTRLQLDGSGRSTRSSALKLRSGLEHSCASTANKQPDKNISNDESAASAGMFLSGEWVRPRSYICGACSQTFTDLYDIEEHKIIAHPNVWCNHYELDEDFALSQSENQRLLPSDLCRRHLQPHGALGNISHSLGLAVETLNRLKNDLKCTKCGKVNFSTPSEFHRHLLECGGDTSWLYGAYSPGGTGGTSGSGNSRRSRKWRPFGSRRRRQQGHKAVKRNVTSTPPTKASTGKTHHRHYRHHIHQSHRRAAKEGDTIQRMIANLPPKRSTRHTIMFDAIKSRRKAAAFMVNAKHTRRAALTSAAFPQNDKRPLLSRRAKISVQHTQSNVISKTVSSDASKCRLLRERSITPVKLKHGGLNGRNHSVPPPVAEDISGRLRSRRRGSLPPENLKSQLDIEVNDIDNKNKLSFDLKPKLHNVCDKTTCLLKGTKHNSDLNSCIKAPNKISKEPISQIENNSSTEKKNNQHLSKPIGKKNSEKRVKLSKGTVLLRKGIVNSNLLNKTKSQNNPCKQQKKNKNLNFEKEDTCSNESGVKKSKSAGVRKSEAGELEIILNSGVKVQNNKVKVPRAARNQGCTTGKHLRVSSDEHTLENIDSIKNDKVKHKLENVSDNSQVEDSFSSISKLGKMKNKENKKKSHQSNLQFFTKSKTEKQPHSKNEMNTCIDKEDEGTSPNKKSETSCDVSNRKQDLALKEKAEGRNLKKIRCSENAAVSSKNKFHKKCKIKSHLKNKSETLLSGTSSDLKNDDDAITNKTSQKNSKIKKSPSQSSHKEIVFVDGSSNSENNDSNAQLFSQYKNPEGNGKNQNMTKMSIISRIDKINEMCSQENCADSNLYPTVASFDHKNVLISPEAEPQSEEFPSSCKMRSMSINQPSLSIVCKEPIKQTNNLQNKTCGNDSQESDKLCDLLNETCFDQQLKIKENTLNNEFKDVKGEGSLKIRNQRKMKQKINKTGEKIRTEQEIINESFDNNSQDNVLENSIESSSVEVIGSIESNSLLLSGDMNTSAKTNLSQSINDETSDILAAMRIAMMEAGFNEIKNDETKRKVETSEIPVRKKLKSDKTEVINETIRRKLCHQCGKSFAYTTPFWRHIQQCKNRNKKKDFNMPTLFVEEPIVKRKTRSSRIKEVDDSIPILSPIDRSVESSMVSIPEQVSINNLTDAKLSEYSICSLETDETFLEVPEDDVVLSDLVKSKMTKEKNLEVGRQCHLGTLGDTCTKLNENKILTLSEADFTLRKNVPLEQLIKAQIGNEKCWEKFETEMDRNQQNNMGKSESIENNVIGCESQKTIDEIILMPEEYVSNDSKTDEIQECEGKLIEVDKIPIEYVNNKLCSTTSVTDETKFNIPTDEVLQELSKDLNNINTCVESCESIDVEAVTNTISIKNSVNIINGEVIEKPGGDNFATLREFHSNHMHDTHKNLRISGIEKYKLSLEGEQVIAQSTANNSISQGIHDYINNADVSNNTLGMLSNISDSDVHKSKTCEKYDKSTLNIDKNCGAETNQFSLEQMNIQNSLVQKIYLNTATSKIETPSKVRKVVSKDNIHTKLVKNACKIRKKFNHFSPMFSKTCRMKKSKGSHISPCRKIVAGHKVSRFKSYGNLKLLSKKLHLSYEVKRKRAKMNKIARNKLRDKIRAQQEMNSSAKTNLDENISKQCDETLSPVLDAEVLTYNFSKLSSQSKLDDSYGQQIKSFELSNSELTHLNENAEQNSMLNDNHANYVISKKKMGIIENNEISLNIIEPSLNNEKLPLSLKKTSRDDSSVFNDVLDKHNSPFIMNKCNGDKLLNTEVKAVNNFIKNIPQELENIQSLNNESSHFPTPIQAFEITDFSAIETAANIFSSKESNQENEINLRQSESKKPRICRKVEVSHPPNHISTEIQINIIKEAPKFDVDNSTFFKISGESQDTTNKGHELNSLLTEDIISAAVAISQLKDKSREHIPLITKAMKNDNHILEFPFHKNQKSVETNTKLLSKEAQEMISTAVAITQLSDIGNGSHSKEFNEINIKKSEAIHLHCHWPSDPKSGDCNEVADSEVISQHSDKEKNKLFAADYCADTTQRKLDDTTKSDISPCLSSNFIVNSDINKVCKTADSHKKTTIKSGYVLHNTDRPEDCRRTHKTLKQPKVKLKVTNKKFDKKKNLETPTELITGNLNSQMDNSDLQTRLINNCSEINEVLNNSDHFKASGNEIVELDISTLDVSTREENCISLNKKCNTAEGKKHLNNGNVGLHGMLREKSEIQTTDIESSSLENKHGSENSRVVDGNICKAAENKNIDRLLKSSEDILNNIECRNMLKYLEHKNKQTSKHSEINNDPSSETVQVNSFLSDVSCDRLVGSENDCIESIAQAHADLGGTEDMLKTVCDNAEYLRAANGRIHTSSKNFHSLKRTEPINENSKIGTQEHRTSKKCEDTQNTVLQSDNSNVIVCQANSNYVNKVDNHNHLKGSSVLELFARDELNIAVPLCTSNSVEPSVKSLSDDEDIPLSLTHCINPDMQEEVKESKNPDLTKYSHACAKTNVQSLSEDFGDCEEEYDIPLYLRSRKIVSINERSVSNADCELLASPDGLDKEATQITVEKEFSHLSDIKNDNKSKQIVETGQCHVTSTLSIKVTLPLRPTLEHATKENISSSSIKRKGSSKKIENVCISPKLPLGKHTKRICKVTISGKNKAFKEKNSSNIKDQYVEEVISNPKDYNHQITSKLSNHSEVDKNSYDEHGKHCEREESNVSSGNDITFMKSYNKSDSLLQDDEKSLSSSRPRRLAKEVALKEVRNHYLMDGEFELLVDDETISSTTLDELSFYMDEISQKTESSATSKGKNTSKTHTQDKNIVLLRSENTKDKKNKSKEKLRSSGNIFEENSFKDKLEDSLKTVNLDKIIKSPIKGYAEEEEEADISSKLKVEDNCYSSNNTSLPLCDHENISQDKNFENIELKKNVKKQQRKQLGLKVKQKKLDTDLVDVATFCTHTIENKTSDNANSEIIDIPKEIIVTAKESNIKDLGPQSINDCDLPKEFPVDSDPKSNPQKECEQSKSMQNINYSDILKYPNFGDPLILSRRERSTRCNLSYEEMYTSSDVSSDSDSHMEISSQSLATRTCSKRRRGTCRRNGVTGRLSKQNSESIIKSIVQNRNLNSKESTQKSEVDDFEESAPIGQKRKRKIRRRTCRISSKNLLGEDNQQTKKLKKFYCFHCKKQFLSSYNFDKHMRSSSHRSRKAVIPIVGVEKNPGPNDTNRIGDIKYTRKSRMQSSAKDNLHAHIKDQSLCNSASKSAEESDTEVSCNQESGWEKRVAIHNSLCEILKAKSSETIVKGSLGKDYHSRKPIGDADPVTSSEDTTVTSCDAVFKIGSEDPDVNNALDAALVIEETATVTSPSDGSVWPSPAATTLTGGTEEVIEPTSNQNQVNTVSEIDKLWETKAEPGWHESLTEEKWEKKHDQSAPPSSKCWVNDVDWTRTPPEVASGTEWSTNEGVPWDIDLHKSSQEWRVVSTTEQTPWQSQPHHQHSESNNWVDDGQWQGAPPWGHGEASSLVSIMDSVSQILESRVAADDEGQLQSSELTSHLFTTPHHQNTAPSLQELQTAMGATDEEMAMLQQLGGGSWVSGGVAETDIIDLDKQQETENTCEVSGIELAKSSGHEKKYETIHISKEDGNQKSLLQPTASQLHPRAPNFEKDRLLAPYETKEMVCPACHRFFLGLTSLQKHVSLAHNGDIKGQSTIQKRSTTGISRKTSSVSGASTSWSGCTQQQVAVAAISGSANSLPRVPCPICRELLVDDEALTKHKQENHVGDPDLPSRSLANAEDSSNSSVNQTTETGSKEDAEGLKSHISTALGGLLDRALNNYLERGLKPGINQPTLSILQTLTAKRSAPLSPSPRYNAELVKQCRKELIGKSSGSTAAERIDEPHPYSCNFCDSRFLQQSTLNRHIDHCHRNTKKESLIREDSKDYTSAGEDSDHSWRESSPVDWNMGTGTGEIGDFLCSDCGINFSTPQEVLKHRKLEHCTHPDPQASQPSSLKSNRSNRGRSWRKDLDIDGETIKAQAVAALRELGNQGRKCGGTAARKAKWGMKFPLASQLPTPGVGSPQSVGFSYPLVRKAPVDGKRFASLVEKKKRNANKPTESLVKDVASDPKQLDVYEFADDEVKPPDLRVPTQAKPHSESVSTDSNAVQISSMEVELPFVERCQRRERRRKSCADLPSDISDVIDDSDSSVGGRPRKMRRARGVTNRRRRRRTGRLSLDTNNAELKSIPSTHVGNETSDEDDGAPPECKRQCPVIGEEEDKLSQSSTDIGVVKPVGLAPSPGESCKKAAARQRRAKSDLLISVFRKCKRSSAMITPTPILDSTSISSCSDAESIVPAPL